MTKPVSDEDVRRVVEEGAELRKRAERLAVIGIAVGCYLVGFLVATFGYALAGSAAVVPGAILGVLFILLLMTRKHR